MSEKLKENQAFAVSNYIIKTLCSKDISDLTNLKLQKTLYFAYGVHYSLYDKKLFEEPIEAWKFGAVVPCVYNEFKDRIDNPITKDSRAVILDSELSNNLIIPALQDDNSERSVLIACLAYGNKKAWDLVDITHKKTSAWYKNYNPEEPGKRIPDEDIKVEFEEYMDELAELLLS